MEGILLLINIFVIPSIVFLFNYVGQGKITNFLKILALYFVSWISNFVISSGILCFFNFLFSSAFTIYNFAYTIIAVISSLIVSFVIMRFKIRLEYKRASEKVESIDEK